MQSIFTQPNIGLIIDGVPDDCKQEWNSKFKQFLDHKFCLAWRLQRQGHLKRALKLYKDCAQQGHQGALFHLYCIFSCGQGVPINQHKWHRPSFTFEADQYLQLQSCYLELSNNAPIQNNLGALFEYQDNVVEALKWYTLSADQNYGPALYNLATYYKNSGQIERAKELFELTAEQNYDLGWACLGDLYWDTDPKRTYEYYRKVCNNSYAQFKIGLMYEQGHYLSQDYKVAKHWYKLSAVQGDRVGQFALAELYMRNKKWDRAIIWYSISAQQGFVNAQYKLGLIYFRNKTYERALVYFHLASEAKYSLAQLYLSICYKQGYGVPLNREQALHWLLLSAKNGLAIAQNNIGYMYLIGDLVPMNYEEAKRWFLLSATQGYVNAQYHLGFIHETGKGVDINYAEAYDWYRLASNQGNNEAKERILWFEQLRVQIQTTAKAYITNHLKGTMNYLFFADLMSHLFKQVGPQPWTDPLIKRWLNEIFLEYTCESLNEWMDALF
jgi:TPR repeat protein